MNNHVNICQNINMIIFFIILVILISLILINKKVKFAIDFSIIGFEYNFCVNINYFFDIITLYKEDLLKYKNNIKKQKNYSSKIIDYKWIIKHINFERINFETKIGLADVFFTSMAIPIVSSTFAIVLQKYFPTSTKTFSVKPVYNKLFLSTKGAIYVFFSVTKGFCPSTPSASRISSTALSGRGVILSIIVHGNETFDLSLI